MSKISNTILVFNTASRLGEQEVILNFIKKNPSPEGEKAAKSYKRVWIFGSIIVVLAFTIATALFFVADYIVDKLDVIPPETAVERSGTAWDDGKIIYTYNKESYYLSLDDFNIGIKIPDETSFFPKKLANVRVFLDKDGNLLDVYPERLADGWVFIYVGIFDIILITACLLYIMLVIGRDWSDYAKWYTYEIEPLNGTNAMEIARTKQYYRPKFPKLNEVTDKELVRKYKSVRRKYILSIIGFVAALAFYTAFIMENRLAKPLGMVGSNGELTLIDYLIIAAIVFISLPVILPLEREMGLLKRTIIVSERSKTEVCDLTSMGDTD